MENDIRKEVEDWLSASIEFVELNRSHPKISEIEEKLTEIQEFLMNILDSDELSAEQISQIKNTDWYNTSNISELFDKKCHYRKKKRSLKYCSCGGIMMKTANGFICNTCGAVEAGYKTSRSSSQSSQSSFERGMDEFNNIIEEIQGTATLPNKIDDKKFSAISEDVIRLVYTSYIGKPEKPSMEEMKAEAIAYAKRHRSIPIPSDADMRKIFKKHGLQAHYRFCNSVKARILLNFPTPTISEKDVEEIKKAYTHVLGSFDRDRTKRKIKNNKHAPSVIAAIMSYLGLQKKYIAVYTWIPSKNPQTEATINNLITRYLDELYNN